MWEEVLCVSGFGLIDAAGLIVDQWGGVAVVFDVVDVFCEELVEFFGAGQVMYVAFEAWPGLYVW